MKRLMLYFTLFFCLFCKAQDKKDKHGDIALFNKGIAVWELYDETLNLEDTINKYDTLIDNQKKLRDEAINLKKIILDKALNYFNELVKQYPKSGLFFRALNNKAQIAYDLGYIKEAKEAYLAIYLSKAKDTEKGGIGSGLMAEPYANYKNRALNHLAEIEYSEGNYAKAIEYLNLTKDYPYQHFCGNAVAAEEIYMAQCYAKNYVALNNNKRALQYLMPHIIENGIADNIDLVRESVTIFKQEFGENSITAFESIKSSLHSKKVVKNKENYNQYYINVLDNEVNIEIPWDSYSPNDNEEMMNMKAFLEKSLFNKLLNEQ